VTPLGGRCGFAIAFIVAVPALLNLRSPTLAHTKLTLPEAVAALRASVEQADILGK
jgi:hypothetical protein